MSFVNKLVHVIFLYTLLLATAEFNADFFFINGLPFCSLT